MENKILNEENLREYRQNHTIKETAEYFGVSYKKIIKLSKEYNVMKYYPIQHINREEFLEYRKNHTFKETKEHFKVSNTVVIKLSKELNFKNLNKIKRESCPKEFTKEQEGYFLGNMLGDGSLRKINKNSNSNFCINQQINKLEYIKFLYNIYKPFSSKVLEGKHRKPSTIDGKINSDIKYWNGEYLKNCCMYTISLPIFTKYRIKWYKNPYDNGRNQKIVPKDIILNWRAAATWACDDGSNVNTISPSNTGTFPYRIFTLHTENFSIDDVEYLIYRLKEDLDVSGKLNFNARNQPIIRLYGENQLKFCRGISPFVPECFQYKCLTRDILPISERTSYNNVSGTIGVYFDNTHKKWIAKYQRNGKLKRKYFLTKEEAINVRKLWEEEI